MIFQSGKLFEACVVLHHAKGVVVQKKRDYHFSQTGIEACAERPKWLLFSPF